MHGVIKLFLALFLIAPSISGAQPSSPLLTAGSQAKDLEFPTEPSSLTIFSTPRLAFYKPEGNGPFPAIVLHHQCGGLRRPDGPWRNVAMLAWARESVKRGYVALVVDSLGPRGLDTLCMGSVGGVNYVRGVRDALQAAAHLVKLDYVDPQRIVFAGYSWGGKMGLLASGKAYSTALAPAERFRAIVAFYPECDPVRPPTGLPYEVLTRDIDRPLLLLLAGLDNETPADVCISRLEPLKAAGAPVDWHLYPEATHGWDSENLDGVRKVVLGNVDVVYRFSRKITDDSANRMFEFFDKAFAASK